MIRGILRFFIFRFFFLLFLFFPFLFFCLLFLFIFFIFFFFLIIILLYSLFWRILGFFGVSITKNSNTRAEKQDNSSDHKAA
ncbi:hypothetical protein DL897_08795 [Thermoflavimicrobium daqui]|uniref:Uncharacterized protein n=1 Tax=Thermoflavimicrobium daqui TaxID=2137476 RepID=A0A364K4X4_9BACL|nr:hypothetical protein DL897_08795 [Thermoflavimicrobium daqui]